MERRSHFDHHIRNVLNVAHYITQQLPEGYDVRIDRNKFLSAFSMVDENGDRVCGRKWPLGPQFEDVETLPQEGV
jgi:hypothetical protein